MKNVIKTKVNSPLTRRVAQLHEEGYEYDFSVNPDRSLCCVQNNTTIPNCGLSIKLIDQIYDHLFSKYKYIHAVEMDSGERGILLLPEIYFQQVTLAAD